MSSEIKVDTISENTSAGGVTIDSLAIKDGKVTNLMNSTLNAADMGAVHIKVASSGDTAIDSNNDDLVIENDNHAGITISTPNDKAGGLYFSDPDDSASGRIVHDHSANTMIFQAGNLEFLRTDSSRKLSTGGEDAADCDAGGLTLDQNANDARILTMKSSDVSHSITSDFEADTYAAFNKSGTGDGGLSINGINDNGNIALQLRGFSNGGEDTGKGTGDHGCVRIDALSRSGTTGAGQGANVNMVTICNQNTVRFIFDAEGDLHSDSSNTTFDAYEDAQLVRAYDLSHGKGVIASKFDDFVKYNQDDLIDAGLVGKINHEYNTDGTKATPLINMSGFMRLHNGAIWQQYEKHQKLANAMYELAKAAVGEDKANEILEQNDIKLLN
jgi:hypothetical protein